MGLSVLLIGHLPATIQGCLSSACGGLLKARTANLIPFSWSRWILCPAKRWPKKSLSCVLGEISRSSRCKCMRLQLFIAWNSPAPTSNQTKKSKSFRRAPGDFIPVPPPSMPEYPPDWYEQEGHEASINSPSPALEATNQNRIHDLLARCLSSLRAIFVPRDKPSGDI